MIPPMNALEATEEMRKAAKEQLEQGMEYGRELLARGLSCNDMSLSTIQADCGPLHGGGRDGEGAVALDWRADPFMSMSDLTLVVYDGTRGTPYHVHTLLLAYGGRKSGFVAEQIKNQTGRGKGGGKKSGSGNVQRQNSDAEYKVDIYVPALAARHVPMFLDYVYGSSPKLTTANAPALRYLSNRFDCRDLHKEVTSRFIPQDLELNTAPQYCTMADELKDFELRDKSIRIMAERFDRMNVKLLKWMSPRMMRTLLMQCDRMDCTSERLSEKVAQYLRLQDDISKENDSGKKFGEDCRRTSPLTDEDFYWLTHCQHMPKISSKEALFYWNYGGRYPQVMSEVGSGSLKSRCLDACSQGDAMEKLTSHLESADRSTLELYENLELKMKVQLLEASLVGAKKAMSEKEKGLKQRDASERDSRLSDELMYKNNKESASSVNVRKVVVLGCGVAPANGVYLHNDNEASHSDGASGQVTNVIFEKEAVWNQQRVSFVLYPATSGLHYTQYKLAARSQNGHLKVLYNSPTVVGGGGSVVPEQAWEVEGDSMEGLHPPPQFVGRVENQAPKWNASLKRSLP